MLQYLYVKSMKSFWLITLKVIYNNLNYNKRDSIHKRIKLCQYKELFYKNNPHNNLAYYQDPPTSDPVLAGDKTSLSTMPTKQLPKMNSS